VTTAGDSENAGPVARSQVKIAPFAWDAERLNEPPATPLRNSIMLLREIGRRLGKLSWLRLMGAAGDVPEWNGANGYGPADCANASAGKNVSPGDIARKILGADSGAAINKVLVVGTGGSEPVTRMEIHFPDPERIPAAFTSLAATLESSGFDLNTLENSSIPATEIWLTYPLNDRNKALLSCAARVGERQAARVAVQSGSPRGQTDSRASVSRGGKS
jgi:hypothetical protein